jgi:hypothetical protein
MRYIDAGDSEATYCHACGEECDYRERYCDDCREETGGGYNDSHSYVRNAAPCVGGELE